MDTIVLITDFGTGSPYVAEMKGAILSVNRHVQIVDGTHAVPPQDVAYGAMVVRQLATAFPPTTVFVCVIDPGVGTPRDILLVNYQDRSFIAPDNGLLSLIADDAVTVAVLDEPEFWSPHVSATFHGRDIMGPAAAHLTLGVPHKAMSSPAAQDIVRLRWAAPQVDAKSINGEVVFIDSFGNLISNIPAADVAEGQGIVEFRGEQIPIRFTYGDRQLGEAVALIGSCGWVEIAIVQGNAREQFQAHVGDKIRYVKRQN